MLLRLRLAVTGALLLWFFLFVFGVVGRLFSSPAKPKAIVEAPAVASTPAVANKVADARQQKRTAPKKLAAVAAPETAHWEP
jgi:hypothetical protein